MRQNNYIDPETLEMLKEEILNDLETKLEQRRPRQYSRQRIASLRRELRKELQAIRNIEGRVQRQRNPEVRALLQEIIEEAREKNVTVGELSSLLGPSSLPESLRELSSNRTLWTALLVILALLTVPTFRNALTPYLNKILAEIVMLGDKTNATVTQLRESIEDIVAEAQFEKIKKALEPTDENEIKSGQE
jgi:hypothetical protein